MFEILKKHSDHKWKVQPLVNVLKKDFKKNVGTPPDTSHLRYCKIELESSALNGMISCLAGKLRGHSEDCDTCKHQETIT